METLPVIVPGALFLFYAILLGMDKFNGTIYCRESQMHKSDFWWNNDLFPLNDGCNTAINKT